MLIHLMTGLDAVEKKFGQGKVDPTKQRGMNEKVTDGVRGMFEKVTGYVPYLHLESHSAVLESGDCTNNPVARKCRISFPTRWLHDVRLS